MKTCLVGGAVRDGLLGREVRARGFMHVGHAFPVFLHPQTGGGHALGSHWHDAATVI